jgi:hypothetical protein
MIRYDTIRYDMIRYDTIRYDTIQIISYHIIGYAVVESQIAYGEAVAVALTISAMTYFKVVHPPAGAYAYLYVNKGMGWKGIFFPGLVGGIVIVIVQKIINGTIKPMLAGGTGSSAVPPAVAADNKKKK